MRPIYRISTSKTTYSTFFGRKTNCLKNYKSLSRPFFSTTIPCKKFPETKQPKDLKFDSPDLFQSKKTSELLFSYIILKACSYDILVDKGPILLNRLHGTLLERPAYWFIKHTFFRQFVAGETIEELMLTSKKLEENGISSFIHPSREGEELTESFIDSLISTCISDISLVASSPSSKSMAIKITGLIPNKNFIKKINKLLLYQKSNPEFKLPWKNLDEIDSFSTWVANAKKGLYNADQEPGAPPPLDSSDLHHLGNLLIRLEKLFDKAKQEKFPIQIDAEQSYFQKALNYLAMCLCKRYNKDDVIVYNTYQQYLKKGYKYLYNDIQRAKTEGFRLGIKLVRGAYLEEENQLAKEQGIPSPINDDINQTHESYDRAVKLILEDTRHSNTLNVCIAGHNEESVKEAYKIIVRDSIDLDRLFFSQLYGMCDHITLVLAKEGIPVAKYQPYGPIRLVMPYLTRRLQENRGILGKTERERNLIYEEIVRRFRLGN